MKQQFTKCLLTSPIFLAFILINAQAQNFVYTNNNTLVTNSVTAFSVASSGALTQIAGSPFVTGGLGTAGGPSAMNRVRVAGTLLFVSNAGSNDISVFSINAATGSLSLVPGSPFPTGGSAGGGISLAVTPDNLFLFAGNAASDDISAFGIAANGALTPVAGSPFVAGARPDGVKVTPDGKFLSVALVTIDAVGIFRIASDGSLTPVPGSPFHSLSAGSVAGVDINCAGNLLFGGQADVFTTVDVFSIGPAGALTLVQASTNPGVGFGSSIPLLSPNENFLFVSNQFTNSVTVFDVATNGILSLVPGSPFAGTGRFPVALATDAEGTFLFTANFTDTTVSSFSIGSNGALTHVGDFPTGRTAGLLSLAAFPPKSCVNFDLCIQDDTNGNMLKLNSNTGAYIFTNCSKGITLTGNGIVTAGSCKVKLSDSGPDPKRPDRSVTVLVNRCMSVANASVTISSTGKNFMIGDSDIRNNICACN
jgi:6-phosphogluconolactonase